jgi:polyisoprenoid-binding protein YceI
VKIVVALAAVGILALGAFVVWYFFLDDDAPPPAALPEEPAGTTVAEPPPDANGTWTVAAVPETFVGYRIQELFANETVKKTAAGRTGAVEGTITITGSTVESGTFTADLTDLESDQGRRDNALRTRGLQTETFPTATFTLTEPIELGATPTAGTTVTATARGDLTLHGVTRAVDVPVEARWNGDTIDVTGRAPIVLADYGMEPPDVAGLLEVDDEGELEFTLRFVPA